jgi:hypothetical protein
VFTVTATRAMSSLKGILYQSGHIDFPRELNRWAFERMASMRSDQEKRIVLNPQVAPLELTRAQGVEREKTGWLESLGEQLNAATSVNLLRRQETLRLRKAIVEIDDRSSIVTLVSQEAFDEFVEQHWSRIAWFYATRHDGFRFDIGTIISMKDTEPERERQMDLVVRVVEPVNHGLASLTFDATGAHAPVNIVDWRKSVAEGQTGRFQLDDTRIRLLVPQAKVPLTFLYERRDEFRNHSYQFSGERLEKQLARAQRRLKARSTD